MAALPASELPVPPLAGAAPAAYQATATWESYTPGNYHRTTIERRLTLAVATQASGRVLDVWAGPPQVVHPADVPPVVELAARLASLYAHVQLQLDPADQPTALLNYAELQQTWQALARDVRASQAPDDPVTTTLLAFADRQMASPAQVLASLQLDYLYQTLLPPLAQPAAAPASRQFAGFFDKTPLWFQEQVLPVPADDPTQAGWRCDGPLDAQQTNLPAVQARMAEVLWATPAPAGTPALPPVLPAPHFHYEATYLVELATGLPVRTTLHVYARLEQLFNQEYTLTIHRL